MRSQSQVLMLFVAGALMLGGCGKSEDQKKAEADLNTQLMQGHHAQMAKVRQVDDLLVQVDQALSRHDSLVAAYPGETAGGSNADLMDVRQKLQSSKDAMESWMASHQPYNEGIKHDQAMAQMQKEMDTMRQVGEQMDAAIADAARVLDEHQRFADSLASAGAGKKRR